MRAFLVQRQRALLGLAGILLVACATNTKTRSLEAGRAVHTVVREYANAHLVVQGERSFLVDSGLSQEAEALDSALRKEGFDPAKLSAIILTHGHADHAGGAFYFQQKYHTRIIAGRDEALLSTGHNEQQICPNGRIAKSRAKDDQAATYPATTADLVIDTETDLGPLTGIEGKLLPLPGHTPGSLVVLVGEAVFVGDLFRGAIVGPGAKRHFYMCDLEDNREKVSLLLETLAPSATLFFPGHLGPVKRRAVLRMLSSWD